MARGRTFVVTMMVTGAALAGAFVATLAPPVSTAIAAELDLAPPPAPSAAVNAPSFADLAERAIPSVVSITSRRFVEEEAADPHDFMQNPQLREFFRRQFGMGDENDEGEGGEDSSPGTPRSRPRERVERSGGSGFFITADGYILTNKHVVDGASELFVRTSEMDDQREAGMTARVVGVDPYLDLALIKVDGRTDFPPLSLGDSDSLRVGEWVIAIGNPIIFRNSVTVGVVSGKQRRIEGGASSLSNYIQTDAAINFGNSGGPLLNARGEVVGINTAILRNAGIAGGSMYESGYVQGVGFALPISPVRRVLDQLAGTGTVKRGYLGVSVGAVTEEAARYNDLDSTRGAYVARVDEGTPAEKAGVQKDDIILAVDGKQIGPSDELVAAISARRPGDKVKLSIWREKKPIDITVTLAERTVGLASNENGNRRPSRESGAQPAEPETASALGFSVSSLSDELRRRLGGRVEGVLITEVDARSAAAMRGVTEGLVVVELNGQPTPSVSAFRKAADGVKPGQVVRLRVRQGRDEAALYFTAPEVRK